MAQILIETVFDMPEKNDFIRLARASAQRSLGLVPSLNAKLDSQRKRNTRQSLPNQLYVGQYYNSIKTNFIDVLQLEGSLYLAFQGLRSQFHPLHHYEYDTFTWQMTHNEAAKRARLMINYPADFCLIRFGIAVDWKADRLYWMAESTDPEPEVSMKKESAID